MWRRLIQRAVPGSLNTVGKSPHFQTPPQFLGSTISSTQSSFICYGSSHFTTKSPFICTQRLFSSNPFPETDEDSPTGIPLPDANNWAEDSGFGGSIFESEEKSDFGFGESLSIDSPDSRFDFYENPTPKSVEFNANVSGNNSGSVLGVENESVPDSNIWGEDSGSGGSIFESDEKSDFGFGESLSSQGSNIDSPDSRFDFYENPSPKSVEFNASDQYFENVSGNNSGSVLGVENESVGPGSENDEDTREKFLEKLENVISLLQSRGTDSSLESGLEGIGLCVNEEAVLKVLQTPLIPGENLIGFFRWALKQQEDFIMSTNVVDALVKAIDHEPRIRDAYGLWDLVNDVGEKEIGVLSTDILNQLICLFSNLGKNKAAYEVFTKFENFRCLPDEDTYFWVIDALSKRSLFDLACSVCEKMLNADKLPDSEKVGKIIYYLCQGNKVKDAHTIYLWAKDRKKFPPSVNCLIRSLCHREKRIVVDDTTRKSKAQVQNNVSPAEKENVYHALEILTDLSEKDRKHAGKPFSNVTKGLCGIGDFAGAKSLLLKMVEMGPPPGYTVFNTLITALSRAGDLDDAKEILKMMEGRGLKPDVYTYSVIVAGYVEGGAMEDACKVLDEAKRMHKKLSPCIYNSLIRGYCKLEQFDTVLKYMREMKVYGVTPSADEYNKLIKLLCLKALDWRTSENLLEEMKKRGVRLYAKTRSLVRAIKELEEEGEATQALPAE